MNRIELIKYRPFWMTVSIKASAGFVIVTWPLPFNFGYQQLVIGRTLGLDGVGASERGM